MIFVLCVLPIGGFVGCMACGVIGAANAPSSGGGVVPAAPAPAAEPQVTVTAQDLVAAYEANEVNAENTYSNRRLRVTGTITGIRTDFTGDALVDMRTGNQFLPLSATLADRNAATTLAQGQAISLNCQCGIAVMGRPNLSDCRP